MNDLLAALSIVTVVVITIGAYPIYFFMCYRKSIDVICKVVMDDEAEWKAHNKVFELLEQKAREQKIIIEHKKEFGHILLERMGRHQYSNISVFGLYLVEFVSMSRVIWLNHELIDSYPANKKVNHIITLAHELGHHYSFDYKNTRTEEEVEVLADIYGAKALQHICENYLKPTEQIYIYSMVLSMDENNVWARDFKQNNMNYSDFNKTIKFAKILRR